MIIKFFKLKKVNLVHLAMVQKIELGLEDKLEVLGIWVVTLNQLFQNLKFSWGGAAMDTAITIRTVVVKDDTAYVQAGAGIVADSDPGREYEETLNKARGMLRALDFAERGLR